MKKTRKLISLLLCLALVVSVMSVAVVSTSAADNPYSQAAMALDAEYAYDGELGAIYSPEATTFKVWAPLATEVKLNRYATGSNEEEGAEDLGTVEMEKLMDDDHWTGVWTTTVSGDIVNTYYTYTVTNPNHIYNATTEKTVETQDPYSYAVGVNGDRSMVVDLSATDPDGWDNDRHVFTDEQTDAIIWEVHVKDFSYAENSGVIDDYRGKFMAFTQEGTTLNGDGNISTCIDYLKKLGITHVQINPFYDFATVNEASDDGNEFNWGYDPKNYGVPEGSYSTNPYDGNVRINECKAMIQALHEAGIGVIMDVVYNHTYSVDSCFTACVPEYYYRMTATGGYSQQSGCGNDTASERAMYRKYMREMLKYWTEEYHIDGYRFDLMGVHDGEAMNHIRDDMDEIDSRIIMYGEGWGGDTVYDPVTCEGTPTYMATQSNSSKLTTRLGFFNDQIRDGVKGNVFHAEEGGFVQNNKTESPAISAGLTANTENKQSRWHAITPEQCLTYASCHDNYTLWDKLTFVDQAMAVSNYRQRYSNVVKQNKLTGAIISSCQGMDFILAGEEMGRSKDGDENSYKSPATLNMIDWSLLKTNADIVSYYRGMFELRKNFSPFTANVTQAQGGNYEYYFDTTKTGTVNPIALTIHNHTEGEWNKIALIFNGTDKTVNYTFKARQDKSINADTEWVIVVNDQQAGVQSLGEVKGLTFSVPAYSAVIAVEKSTFEEAALSSDFSTLTVNSVAEDTGEVLASTKLTGKPGEGYELAPDTSIPIEYDLDYIDGDPVGTFSEEDKTVTFNYKLYVPERFTAPDGDINDDGVVDILDVTYLQRYLAYISDLDEEHVLRGDYDQNGVTDTVDVTILQRWLAGMIEPVYTVTTRHLGRNEDGSVKALVANTTDKYRYGEFYETSAKAIAYYKLDEMPTNASGTVNKKIVVTYWYSYSIASPKMHVKHSGDLTWDPNLWAWAYDDKGTAINCYEEWPGKQLTDSDGDGWYDVTFPIPGGLNYYFIISKNGNPQTKDYGVVNGENVGISYDDYPEVWVVIQDDLVGKNNGDWCKYYNYNPDLEN